MKSFPYPDKQETLEEDRRIKQLKDYVTNNNNKDEDNSPKNSAQNITHQTSFKKFRQIAITLVNSLLFVLTL